MPSAALENSKGKKQKSSKKAPSNQKRQRMTFKQYIKSLTKEKVKKTIIGSEQSDGFIKKIVVYALLIGIGFVYLYPLLYMISTSFMDTDDLLDTSVKWIPSGLYMANYLTAAKSMNYWVSLLKSIIVSLSPTMLNVVIGMVVGYGFARFDFPGKKIMFGLLILSFIIPRQVTMIPTYVLYSNMGILASLKAYILPSLLGQGLNAQIYILIFYQFFKQVPKVLIEAALIDGAGYFKSFLKIAIPSAAPAILTVFLFSFVWYWNESYLMELYVKGVYSTSIWTTLVVQLKNFDTSFNTLAQTGDAATNLSESVRMAATALSILPFMFMYTFLQRYFIESIDRTGITGE